MSELTQQLTVIDQAIQQAHNIIEAAADEAQLKGDKAAIAKVMEQAGELMELINLWELNNEQLFTDIDDKGAEFSAWSDEDNNEDQAA